MHADISQEMRKSGKYHRLSGNELFASTLKQSGKSTHANLIADDEAASSRKRD